MDAQLFGVSIGSNGNAFVVGTASRFPFTNRIYKSTVASQFRVWNDYTPPNVNQGLITVVATVDGNSAIAVGYDRLIYYTSNGGVDWRIPDQVPVGGFDNLNCVSTVNSLVALAAGDNSYILKTNGGGRTWFSVISGYSSDVLQYRHHFAFML